MPGIPRCYVLRSVVDGVIGGSLVVAVAVACVGPGASDEVALVSVTVGLVGFVCDCKGRWQMYVYVEQRRKRMFCIGIQ